MFPEEKKEKVIYDSQKYKIEKQKLEKRTFKLNTPSCYVKINKNDTDDFFNKSTLKECEQGDFDNIAVQVDDDEYKEVEFIDLWFKDPNHLKKDPFVFDHNPNNDNSRNCNKRRR